MNNSSFAIAYLYEFNLLDVILQPSKYCEKNIIENLFLPTTNLYILGEYLYEKMNIFDIEFTSENFNKIDYGLLLLTLYFRNVKVKFGKEKTTINKLILRETLKTSNDYIKENVIMNENIDELILIINSNNYSRLSVGKILKKIHYKNIVKILLASICYEYLNKDNLNELITDIDDSVIQTIIKIFIFLLLMKICYILMN